MLMPVPLFAVREYGTVREQDHVCHACGEGHLQEREELDKVRVVICDACGERTPAGWRRRHYSDHRPGFLFGSLDVRTGPLFASVQHYMARPDPDDESPYHLADLMFDIDFEDDLPKAIETARKLTLYLDSIGVFHRTFFSGSKGFHVEVPWNVVGALPSRHLHEGTYKQLVHALAQELGLEFCMQIYTRGRMFRIAGTMHPKTGYYKTWLPDELLSVDQLTEILERADTAPEVPDPTQGSGSIAEPHFSPELHRHYQEALRFKPRKDTHHVKPIATFRMDEHPACVRSALQDGPPGPGTRHALSVALAAYWAGIGGDSEEFVEWAQSVPGASPTSEHERVREARQAIRWAKSKRPPFRCPSMQDLGLCDPACPFFTQFP
jgi:hypothetical protein